MSNKNNELKDKIKLYMVIYFFYGFILLFFGKEIEAFFDNMTELQKIGLFFVILGLVFYTLTLSFIEKTTSIALRIIYFLITITLLVSALLLDDNFSIPSYLDYVFVLFIFITIFVLPRKIILNLISITKRINNSIEDRTQKITILIGFFGILISLLTIIK